MHTDPKISSYLFALSEQGPQPERRGCETRS